MLLVSIIWFMGCAADLLGADRAAANVAADAISAESARVEMSVRLAAYRGIAACGASVSSTPACRASAVDAALAAGSAAIERVNRAATLQRAAVDALNVAASCESAREQTSCFDDAKATAEQLLGELDGGAP